MHLGLVRLHSTRNHLKENAEKDEAAAHPLHLVERVRGVAEDRVYGRKDLARRRHSRDYRRLLRQYLYFCTSKASNVRT